MSGACGNPYLASVHRAGYFSCAIGIDRDSDQSLGAYQTMNVHCRTALVFIEVVHEEPGQQAENKATPNAHQGTACNTQVSASAKISGAAETYREHHQNPE